ncbi:MAG: hypothetical protein Q4D80_04740, partial [Pseudomonadota bacterium]|nr:hypothetical protein [Pseudomonadota bacterium]
MRTTFLTEDQIWGNNALEVIKKYGTRTGLTDLTVALGGCMGRGSTTSEGEKAGYVWSASAAGGTGVRVVDYDGDQGYWDPSRRKVAGRPVLPSSETSKIRPNAVRAAYLLGGQVKICEYGEYPQDVVSGRLEEELESAYELEKNYKNSALQRTGKRYTFDAADIRDYAQKFQKKEYEEYMLNGRKYVRIEGKRYDGDSVLSDGRDVRTGDPYWFEVKPIEWLMDEKSGIWVAKKALFAGIQFDGRAKYNGNFEQTDMKKYLDNYFSEEMQNSQGFQIQNSYKNAAGEKAEPSKRQKGYGIQVVEEPLP